MLFQVPAGVSEGALPAQHVHCVDAVLVRRAGGLGDEVPGGQQAHSQGSRREEHSRIFKGCSQGGKVRASHSQ